MMEGSSVSAAGVAALQKYREEHPDVTLRNLARARQAASLVNKARYQKARELRQEKLALGRLLSRFPRNMSRAEQIKWLRDQMLKLAKAAVAPPPWVLPALRGVLACVQAMPADSDDGGRGADAAHIAFLQSEVRRLEAEGAQWRRKAQEAEQESRERAEKAAAAREVVIEPAPKTTAAPAVPAEVSVWIWQQNGRVHPGLTRESAAAHPGFTLTEHLTLIGIR